MPTQPSGQGQQSFGWDGAPQQQPDMPNQVPPAQHAQYVPQDPHMYQAPQGAYAPLGPGWGNYSSDSIPSSPPKRPASVVIASIAAWIWGAFYVVGSIVIIVYASSASYSSLERIAKDEDILEAARRGISTEQFLETIRYTLWIMSAFSIVIGLFALITGVLAFKGSNGWRIFGIVATSLMLFPFISAMIQVPHVVWLSFGIVPLTSLICWSVSGSWYRAVKDYKRLSLYRH
ncbi:hypothetical protein [Arthrobacter sp. HMSC06H05]|uniref:hypothetical protein n=1 Tax=Arthrobacter sp. HMSC06H05 TaxID=1581128 RepID=UPI00114CB2A2|nr:hypothetical protein [Arthrobacter sp. HMSC06H05]